MSRIRTNLITNRMANGAPTVSNGLVISGVTTSTTFSGSGASLTNLPSAQLTGALPALDGSNLTGITQTTINSNADNRIVTGSGTANTLNGEANLTFDGTTLTVSGNASANSVQSSFGGITTRLGFVSGSAEGVVETTSNHSLVLGVNSNEKLRITSAGQLIFDADTDTYIHRPQANQLAITVAGGSFPMVRFGTGGSSSTVGFSTDSTLVTNSERISVRGFSSFKSTSNVYAAIYTHNEGNTSGTYNAHLLWNAGGANRGGIGYMPNNGEVIFNNQNPINFATGATNLGGTTRLRIDNNGIVTMPNQPAFRAYLSGGPQGINGTVPFDQIDYNIGSNYNNSNYRFTAPVAGRYSFHFYSIYRGNHTSNAFGFYINGGGFSGDRAHFTKSLGNNWDYIDMSQVLNLGSGDYVTCLTHSSVDLHGGNWASFSGHLVG